MPETVFGLPVHPLLVHATVVLVPLTATAIMLAVFLPRFRAWAGWIPLGLAVISTALAPLSTSTGENLQRRLPETKLIREHAELGDMLLWWCLGMLAVAAALTVVHRRTAAPSKAVAVGLMVAGVVVGVGTMVQVVLIGHSGAEAAWGDLGASTSSRAPAFLPR